MKMAERKIAFQGALLIDGNGDAPIENSLVLIEDDKFTYAGPAKDVDLSGYEVCDVSGKTLLPGLVECHTHLAGTLNPDPGEWMGERNTYEAIVATSQAKTLLDYGFTTVRDISRYGLDLKKAIENGTIEGPRLWVTGRGIARTGGHGDWPFFDPEVVKAQHPWAIVADGVEECRKTTRYLLSRNVDGIKIWASGGGLHDADIDMDTHLTREEIQMIVDEANYLGKPVIAHCEGLESAIFAIEAGCYSIEHGEEMDDYCIEQLKARGTYVIPTLMVFVNWYSKWDPPYRPELENYPGANYREKALARIFDNFRKCKEAGVKMGCGADSFASNFTPYGSDSLKEVHCFVDAGCTEMEALVSATKIGAEILQYDDICGTIETGKYADLIVLDKNPLENIRNLEKENMSMVMKEGKAVWSTL